MASSLMMMMNAHAGWWSGPCPETALTTVEGSPTRCSRRRVDAGSARASPRAGISLDPVLSSDDDRLEALRALRNGEWRQRRKCSAALEFAPALTASQRALLHANAAKLGLGHESVGLGRLRRVRVWVKDLETRLDDLEAALEEEERASTTISSEAATHASAVAAMRMGLLHCRHAPSHGTVARVLSFLLGPGVSEIRSDAPGGGNEGAEPFEECGVKFLDDFLDQEQRMAVMLCMGAWGEEKGAVIHGPAGSGKTRALVEVVRQRVRRGQRILVCTSSAPSLHALHDAVAAKEPHLRMYSTHSSQDFGNAQHANRSHVVYSTLSHLQLSCLNSISANPTDAVPNEELGRYICM